MSKATEAEVIPTHKVVNVSEMGEQQHNALVMQKVLEVYTIETKQELQATLAGLESERNSRIIHCGNLHKMADALATKAMDAHHGSDESCGGVVAALKKLGLPREELRAMKWTSWLGGIGASNSHFPTSLPWWARESSIQYRVELAWNTAEGGGRTTYKQILANKKCSMPKDLAALVKILEKEIKIVHDLGDKIDQLRQKLKELPDQSEQLKAQILRQQIKSDIGCGEEMTKLLDKARTSGRGMLRLL